MNPRKALKLALQYHQNGRLKEAEDLYRKVLESDPENADALHLLGVIAQQQNRCWEAAVLIRKAITISPEAAVYHCNLGIALDDLGRVDEALAAYERAVGLKPDYPKALTNMGVTLRAQGRLEEAIVAHRRAIETKPTFADAHNNLGVALAEAARPDDAIAAYLRAVELKPDFAEAHNHMGLALYGRGRLEEAIACYRRAIAHKPGYADAYNHLGVALSHAQQSDEAIASYGHAIELKADFLGAQLNLAAERAAQGQLEMAMDAYRQIIANNNDNAEAHLCLAHALLLQGEFREGWKEYEWRWKTKGILPSARNFPQPRWDGGLLEGRVILLHAEQGLGDTLQFVRYAPLVAQRGGRIIVECQPGLQTLLEGVEGISQIFTRGEPLPEFDVHCPMMSLPLAFKTRVETIPATIPYLRADPQKAARWRERLNPAESSLSRQEPLRSEPLKVGLLWAGGSRPHQPDANRIDRRRSVRLSQFAPLAGVNGVVFVSLQKGDPADQAQAPPGGMTLLDWTDELNDFADTAALVEGLDLVISVDTSTAHLAGAVGKPVWLLNRFDTCWRWLRDRSDTPWYPTMRLFRQPKLGNWESVIAAVRGELQAFVETNTKYEHPAGA